MCNLPDLTSELPVGAAEKEAAAKKDKTAIEEAAAAQKALMDQMFSINPDAFEKYVEKYKEIHNINTTPPTTTTNRKDEKCDIDSLPEKFEAFQRGAKYKFWYTQTTSMLPEQIAEALKRANENGELNPDWGPVSQEERRV